MDPRIYQANVLRQDNSIIFATREKEHTLGRTNKLLNFEKILNISWAFLAVANFSRNFKMI